MLRADARAAMAARIVQCPDRALPVSNDNDRVIADLRREIVPRPRDFAIMADEQPILVPDLLQVLTVIISIDVEGAVEAVAFATGLQLAQHFGLNFHALVLVFPPFRRGRTGTRAGRMDPQRNWLRSGCPPQPATVYFCFKAGFRALEPSARDLPGAFPDAVSSGLLPWLFAPPPLRGQRRDLTGFPILRPPFEAAP